MLKRIIVLLSVMPVICLAQPANDNSCGAISIPVENLGCEPSTVYSYTAATWSSGSGNSWCESGQNLDVWYSFIVPSNGQAQVSLATVNLSESYNAEFYNGSSCNGLTIFNSSSNGFPCLQSGEARTFTNLAPGSSVYFRIYRRFGTSAAFANGSFKICVSNNFTLTDEPCNAGFFPVNEQDPLGQDCVPVNNYSWTGASLTPSIPNPSCISPMPGANVRDVWFKIRVPASGRLRLNHTYNGTCMVAYTATACNGTFTELGCTFFGLNWLNLTPGSIIYVRMMRYTGTSGPIADGSAKICAAESNALPAINNSTKVGIGIDSPFAKLDVVGTGIFRDKLTTLGNLETRGDLIVQGNIISKYGNTRLPNNTTVGGALSVDSLSFNNRLGNHVSLYGGLGTANHYGLGIQSGLLQIYSDASNSAVAFGHGNSNNFTERGRFFNNGETALRINGRLQIQSGSQTAGLWLANSVNSANVAFVGLPNDNHVGFFGNTGAGWGLTMNAANGNVGIGTNTPSAPLSFGNPFGKIAISLFKSGNGDVGLGVWGNELRLQNDVPNGKVSMGVLEAGATGVYQELAKAERNGAYAFSIFGSLWVNGTTYASDERFKQEIRSIVSPLEKLLQIRGVEYEMNAAAFPAYHFMPGRQIGLLAQNVEKVIPEAVSEQNGYKGVDYARLVPLLIEAIKEQQKQIDELKRIIESSQRR